MHVSLLYYYLSTSEMVHTDANVAIYVIILIITYVPSIMFLLH